MDDINKMLITSDIESAKKLYTFIKWVKILLALCICVAYFTESSWLIETIVISIVIALLFPLGFFDIFIQKLLEYNTQVVEERQLLNANESNKHFEKAFKKIDELENNCKH